MAGRRPKISDMPPLKGSTAVDASAYEEDIQMKVSAWRAFVIAGWAVDVAVCESPVQLRKGWMFGQTYQLDRYQTESRSQRNQNKPKPKATFLGDFDICRLRFGVEGHLCVGNFGAGTAEGCA